MAGLPSGTVSLLFSDIEGSTVLLSRLGPAYAEALDGQRRVLRDAWAAHGGTEMGTEGDSFFVVFPTAGAAVSAAAQAQRRLAEHRWPAGEQVRVRMGIHTGSPAVHDGGYVGLDVHRAARIASAAHGGQVVVSQATAYLLDGCLPETAGLRDLGSHQLKDLAVAERLFQLTIGGLDNEFAPLKTLGAASSLPRPATPLVGRDGELAELTALVASPQVRLVTLTGPGGSGKTRLATEVAHRLIEMCPDGVYFVPLAAATTEEVMWTSIAETLDVPPEGRMPPGFFTHVAHRSALFVLDNLEQLAGADRVVAGLLEEAPNILVIATSRRPLHVAGEHEHLVPPLELPDGIDVDEACASGAVQMFVEQARMVRPRFAVTADNAAQVAAICLRLDGLPLGIELAAARSKLLSPRALLKRLNQALDIAASGAHGPGRQRTLRDTIAWSYELLGADQQTFFRRLGVFAGSADLDALTAVATASDDHVDVLDLVAELADASLVTIGENSEGEPRVGLLETIGSFAQDQLRQTGELEDFGRIHAEYYLGVVEHLHAILFDSGVGDQLLDARRRFEIEHDNVRKALSWALGSDGQEPPSEDRLSVGLRLCAVAGRLWFAVGSIAEGRRWLLRAISLAGEEDSLELAICLSWLAGGWFSAGDLGLARDAAARAVAVCRRLGDKGVLSFVLGWLGYAERRVGDLRAARGAHEEAVDLAREIDDRAGLSYSLGQLSRVEFFESNYDRALELIYQALNIDRARGSEYDVMCDRFIIAMTFRGMGRLREAHRLLARLTPQMLHLAEPEVLTELAEEYAGLLGDLGHHERATELMASAEAMRTRNGTVPGPAQQADADDLRARTQAALGEHVWHVHHEAGHNMIVEKALSEVVTDALVQP
ncbi:MAG: tetratricopeptide repeat protein [Nocardioidaceae bacterium]